MPKLRSNKNERGDLLAQVKIHLPTQLSNEEKTHFEALRDLRSKSK
jgi:DnaJ-class molecular chaperone